MPSVSAAIPTDTDTRLLAYSRETNDRIGRIVLRMPCPYPIIVIDNWPKNSLLILLFSLLIRLQQLLAFIQLGTALTISGGTR